jgi:hypothetical protein
MRATAYPLHGFPPSLNFLPDNLARRKAMGDAEDSAHPMACILPNTPPLRGDFESAETTIDKAGIPTQNTIRSCLPH